MRKVFIAIVGVVSMLAVGVACGGDSKTIKTEDGDVEIKEGKLPDDWPKNFPVFKDAKLLGSLRGEQEGIEGSVVTWEVKKDLDEVRDFYNEQFDGGDWKATSSGGFGDSAFWTVEQGDGDLEGWISVSQDGDTTTIVAIVGTGVGDLSGGDSGDDSSSDSGDDSGDDSSGDSGDDSDGDSGDSTLPPEVDLFGDFPSDRVPLPDDIRIVSSGTVSQQGSGTFATVEFLTKDSPDDVSGFFEDELPGVGWSNDTVVNSDGSVYMSFSASDGAENVALTIAPSEQYDGYTQVDIVVTFSEE